MIKSIYSVTLIAVWTFLLNTPAVAQETRLLRNPAVSKEKISFVYAGDIWVANLDGTNVKRITAFGQPMKFVAVNRMYAHYTN